MKITGIWQMTTKMKDSKIEWVGEIPENWEVKRIKYIVKIRNGNGFYNPETDIYIGMENIKGYSNEIVATNSEYETSVQSTFEKGDILFGKLRPYLAKVIEINCSGFCSSEFLIFSGFKGYKSFLRFSLLNPKFIENINASTYGAKMPRANSEYILNQKIAIPPFTEQKEIAEYLDEKCGEIDALLADIKDEIETLEQYKRSVITESVTKGLNPSAPLKKSGIEWVGEIPEHWEVKRIAAFYRLRNNKVSDKDFAALSVTKQGVLPQLETVAKTDDGDNRKLVRIGDFVINSRSDRRGSCGISNYDGSVSLINIVLEPRSVASNKYYNWLFHTEQFADEFYKWGNGIVDDLWTTRWQNMKRITIPVPPLSEQQEIAEFLDKKCAEIDAVISDKQTEIQTLESYKKSLIYEYVTGKKEVKSDV